MRNFIAFIVLGSGLVLASLLSNCTNSQTVMEPQTKSQGVALLKISVLPNSPFTRIAKTAVLTISAADMLKMTRSLSLTDSSVEGFIKGIPAGKNRVFNVSVYDSLEQLQYSGSASADVKGDSTVLVLLSLYRVNGNAIINGKVIDTGDVSVSDSGLVAYWSFDSSYNGTYLDATGHGYNASSSGLSLAPGIKDSALNCLGTAYELIVNNSKDHFDFPRFTIETWFYSNIDFTTEKNIFMKIFDYQKINSGIYNGYGIHITAEGQIAFGFGSSDIGWVTVLSNTVILSKRWYHIVCTYDGNYLKEYVNGKLDNSTHYSGAMYALPHASARIGCQTLSDGTVRYPINGMLDEMKLYNFALSAETIMAHFTALD
jgi:hypothetical protein